ncbi:NF038120 family PEP-CTERM protein [Duganella callida]|uniref:NF038120 family PEP-CTERM protein n=1 Tax=Duganella callida TaxID=2561932 RepID=UPI00197AA2D0|nr:NF038120 family PEP-CTERM protein [Duganella callida]
MSLTPFKHLAYAALGVLALAGAPSAYAGAVIDFESAPLGPIGSYDPVGGPTLSDVFVSNGFYVGAFTNAPKGEAGDLVASVVDGSDVAGACWNLACPTSASNSSKYLASLNDGVIDIFHTSGSSFRIQSFDASFIGNYDTGTFPAGRAGVLRIQGFTALGNSLSQDFVLAGPGADGFAFAHQVTTGAFANTDFVEFIAFAFACDTPAASSCTVFNSNRGQFALDNIATTAAVPEPSTWLMLGAGLLAVGAITRRRQA